MKIMLIEKNLGIYVRDLDHWTARPEDALTFTSTVEALEFCFKHDLTDLSIKITFANSSSEGCVIDINPTSQLL
jgi:hypothetical protein